MMNRISIVGISGSGKSTLANKLGKKLNLPVFHLDKYLFDVGWKRRYESKTEFASLVDSFAMQDRWIIDGNHRSAHIDFRFERADTIIFLDFPKWRCLWRVFIRTFKKKQPFDKTQGVKEKTDLDLIKRLINYKTEEMRERVAKHKSNKRVFVIKNNKELKDLFLELGN